jgi:DHHA2 domain.
MFERKNQNLITVFYLTAKMDITGMSTFNILRKDYKSVQRNHPDSPSLGISGAIIATQILMQRGDFLDTSFRYMEEQELHALLIMLMTFGGDGAPVRQIIIVSKDKNLMARLCDHLRQEKELELTDCEVEKYLNDYVRLFDHNSLWSRKKVMPVVVRFA